MIRRILWVTHREYLAYVKTRTFLISALAFPIMLIIGFSLPVLLESTAKPARTFTILDPGDRYATDLLNRLFAGREEESILLDGREYHYIPPTAFTHQVDRGDHQVVLEQAVQDGRLFAFLVLTPADSTHLCDASYFTIDPAAEDFPRVVRHVLTRVVALQELLPRVGDETVLLRGLDGLRFATHAVTEKGGELATAAHMIRSYAPMAIVYMLWVSVLVMSSHLMTSTIEEKSTRVIEVLLSSVSSFEFMMGKLVGLAGAGLTMLFTWAVPGALLFSVVQNPTVQQVGAGLGGAFSGTTIFWFITFFLLGFLFFASIYVGVGSVCNTLRDAQSLLQPVMFVLMIPLFLMVYVTNNPDSIISVVASFFPPFTPFVIMNRIPANPPAPLWQIVGAALLLLLSTWLMVRLAAKVFRIGILMYGKAPTLPEILRWARQRS